MKNLNTLFTSKECYNRILKKEQRISILIGFEDYNLGGCCLVTDSADYDDGVVISGVTHTKYQYLTRYDAILHGFDSLEELQECLKFNYPYMNIEDDVTILYFGD